MDDESETEALVYLRRLDEKVDGVRGDLTEIKERLGLLESQYASLSRRVDRMGGDIEQIKRRRDLVPAE